MEEKWADRPEAEPVSGTEPLPWQWLFDTIRSDSIVEGVARYAPVEQSEAGPVACCPVHKDSRMGDVRFREDRQRWKCRVCRAHGSLVEYLSRLWRIPAVDAALEIGVQKGLLTEEERAVWSARRGERVAATPPAKKKDLVPRPDPVRAHQVYQAFIACCPPLTEEHRTHLLEVRKIQGWEEDFFEWPARLSGRFPKLVTDAVGLPLKEAIAGVPGFAWDSVTDRMVYMRLAEGGIGIAMRDEEGRIAGLQIRLDGMSRYRMFSSTWANVPEADETHSRILGNSCGQVPDILRPRSGVPIRGAAITEGKFKGIALAQRGWLTLALVGVNNTKSVLDRFLSMPEQAGNPPVTVFFDMDLFVNPEVTQATRDLCAQLEQRERRVFLGVWEERYGKGVDDVILGGHEAQIRTVPWEDVREQIGSGAE